MSTPHIANVDRMDDGILVTFTNDVVVLFGAETLWNNRHLAKEPIAGEKEKEGPEGN